MVWLDRYEAPLPIRCRGAFHVYAARDRSSGEARVVIVPAPHASVDAASERLSRVARAHERLGGDGVPALAEHGSCNGLPFVALSSDASCDGEAIIQELGETQSRVSYGEATAVVDRLGAAIARAHAAGHTLGALSWANVLIRADGALELFGIGHNTVVLTEHGAHAGAPSVFIAPEIATGAAPTPSADVYAFVMLQRSVLPYCVLPAALDRAFRGEVARADRETLETIQWVNERVVTAPPLARATIDQLRAHYRREWELVGVAPDEPALRARLSAMLEDADPSPADHGEGEGALTIGPDAAWVRTPEGETYDLRGRGPLRRLLMRLAQKHREARGERVDTNALLEAGWPGERPIREAGLNRVYVALSTLRKMGLRDAIDRDDRGYRIDPAVKVRLEGIDP